jgi:phosphatidylethanolamine/phosphatidyl-N-methylethanolamine N-methyltransferase
MSKALDAPLPSLEAASELLDPNIPAVEFGPGTGRITRFLKNPDLTLVEIDSKFCGLLHDMFPQAKVVHMSAVDFLLQQQSPIQVVTSIPLLNNPESFRLKEAIRASYEAGIIQKLVAYTYGPVSPYGGCGFRVEKKFQLVLRNIPPARVWVYG